MNKSVLLLLAVFGVLMYFTSNTVTIPANATFDLTQLTATYGADSINALLNLYTAILNTNDPITGSPLSSLQQQLLLSQAIHETGLFTSNPNWKNINSDNNYAGITAHGSYQGDASGYAVYPSIQSFVNDWLNILSNGSQPLEAVSISDFASRLKSNGYYTDSLSNYQNALQSNANILNQVVTLQTSAT